MSKSVNDIQSEVFKNLINALLRPQNVEISALSDLNQGTALLKFAQVLLGETIEGWKEIPDNWKGKIMFKQRIVSQVTANFQVLQKHLATKDKSFKFINAPESEKDLIGLVWLIISKFYVVQPKRNLVNIISDHLKDFTPSVEITNMGSSWENGLPFIALLSKSSNGTIEYADKGNAKSNCDYIKESCDKLSIPFVLTENCISDQLDENCICIQAAAILKTMSEPEVEKSSEEKKEPEKKEISSQPQTQQQQNKNDDEKKKFDTKIEDYKKVAQIAIELTEGEEAQLKKLENCLSLADIQDKRNYIHQYNASKKKEIQQQFYKVKESWEVIERNSKRTKLPIPSDIIKLEDIKGKMDQLEENVKSQNSSIESEENELKKIGAEIKDIDDILDARKKFDELKSKFDMDKWEELPHNSLPYILGDKLQKYENKLKETIADFEETILKFNEDYDDFVSGIENNSKDSATIDKIVEDLMYCYVHSCSCFNTIKRAEESYQTSFDEIEFSNKLKSAEKKAEEYKSNRIQYDFEKEFNEISQKCETANSEIQKIDDYKNVYSTDLKNLYFKEHPIILPDYERLEQLFEKCGDDEKLKDKLEEAKSLIRDTSDLYDNACQFLIGREKESKKISNCSFSAMKKCKEFQKENLSTSIVMLAECRELINEAENEKKWDESATGDAIDDYNKFMKQAYEIIQNGENIIEEKFNEYLEEIKESLANAKDELMKETDDYDDDEENYQKGLDLIADDLEKLNALQITDDKMNFNKKDELDELQNELNEAQQSFQKLSDDFPSRLEKHLEEINEKLSSMNEDKKYLNDLNDYNSKINKLTAKEVDQKGKKILSDYVKILKDRKNVEDKIKKYNFDMTVADTTSVTNLLHDLIIIYNSTLLLNSKSFTDNIKERTSECSDSSFSLLMAFLYVNKFTEDNEIFSFENISKEDILSTIDPDQNLIVEVSTKICKLLNSASVESEIKVNILCDFLTFYPDYEESLKNYLNTSVDSAADIRFMLEHLQEFEYIQPSIHLIDIFNECLDKSNSLSKGKLCEISKDDSRDDKTIVADFGSYETRIGFAGELSPRRTFRTVIGRPKYQGNMPGMRDCIGDDAIYNSSKFSLSYPIEEGHVSNWDQMDRIINFAFFNELRVDPSEHSILISEKIGSMKWEREHNIEVLFETYKVPSFCMVNSSVLDVYSTGRYTGFAVDIGYQSTTFAPVVDGFHIPALSSTVNIGGRDLSELMVRQYSATNLYVNSSDGKRILDDVKRRDLFVSLDVESEEYKDHSITKELPDGSKIVFDKGRYMIPEFLFNPEIDQRNEAGIVEAAYETIEKNSIDYRNKLYKNIVVCGGSTKITGLRERFQKDINQLAKLDDDIELIKPDFKEDTTWSGGSLFASCSSYPLMVVTRDEYDDAGVRIVHSKCIY